MKKLIFVSLLSTLLLGSFARAEDPCADPGRDRRLCQRMLGLRVRLNLIDAQLDLLQTRYTYYQALSEDMDQWVRSILIESRNSDHLQPLDGIRKTAREVALLARSGDFKTLQVANSLRVQCMSCHASENPRSGRDWDKISQGFWSKTVAACLQAGTNPYRCKLIQALKAQADYLEGSSLSPQVRYDALTEIGYEISRISADLLRQDPDLPSRSELIEIKGQGEDLQSLAQAKDAQALDRADRLALSIRALELKAR